MPSRIRFRVMPFFVVREPAPYLLKLAKYALPDSLRHWGRDLLRVYDYRYHFASIRVRCADAY